MSNTVYRHFACPDCLRLTTKPWRAAWCTHHDSIFTPHNPEDPETDWTQMVEISERVVRLAVEGIEACRYCHVPHDKCQPGGRFYEICPFNPTEGGHEWIIRPRFLDEENA